MKYIHRHIEQLVQQTSQNFKCLLLTGARQTGKSTLLKSVFKGIRYVEIDDVFIEEQARENPAMFLSLNRPPVIFDEIQRVPGLFRNIKQVCDDEEDSGMFIMSGSQPLELMAKASESLSGRVGILELSGLSLREMTGIPFTHPFVPTMEYLSERAKHPVFSGNIWEIIHRGSYPELQKKSMDWNIFYSSYVKTYLERDVRQISAVQNLDDFRRFMISVAARTGQVVNYTAIANEVGRDLGTIRNWLSILESSGIIYQLEAYAPTALRRAIHSPKIYFRDTGLAAYLLRWLTPETLANGAMSGALFETFVIGEILKSFSNKGIDYRYCVSYYRGRDKKKRKINGETVELECEIDLIIEENGILYPIEIKQSPKVTADETSAFTVLDSVSEKKRGTGAIVCACPMPGMLRDNILQIPVTYL